MYNYDQISNIHIRVTDIVDYYYCPRKIYIKKVLNIKSPDNDKKILGSIIHDIFDFLNDNEKNILINIKDFLEFDSIYRLYEDFISKQIDNILERYMDRIKKLNMDIDKIKVRVLSDIGKEIEFRVQNVYNFIKNNDVYGIELVYNLDPIIYSEYDVYSNKYDLAGRIDRLEVHKNEKIMIPYELKTGFFQKEHIIQLYSYYLLLKDEFKYKNFDIPKGILLYTRDNYKKEIDFKDRYFLKRNINLILSAIDSIYEMIYNKKDPGLNTDKNKCLKCEFFNICYKK